MSKERFCWARFHFNLGKLRIRLSIRLPVARVCWRRFWFSVSMSCLMVFLPSPVMVGDRRWERPMSWWFKRRKR